MELYSNWPTILRKAWSIRFMALAVIFATAEAALPALDEVFDIPRGLFALLTILAVVGAGVSRLVAQRSVDDPADLALVNALTDPAVLAKVIPLDDLARALEAAKQEKANDAQG